MRRMEEHVDAERIIFFRSSFLDTKDLLCATDIMIGHRIDKFLLVGRIFQAIHVDETAFIFKNSADGFVICLVMFDTHRRQDLVDLRIQFDELLDRIRTMTSMSSTVTAYHHHHLNYSLSSFQPLCRL